MSQTFQTPRNRNNYYEPDVWIEGNHMFATCRYLNGKTYVDTRRAGRITFERRLMGVLRDEWGVLASELKLKYVKNMVIVQFDNPMTFVKIKLRNQ